MSLWSSEQSVRKHPAPEGALRHPSNRDKREVKCVRKHPAPEGALRQAKGRLLPLDERQKAPSTTRCIKTRRRMMTEMISMTVRKQPAPEGALRPKVEQQNVAPERCQKAPSTTRCIKTGLVLFVRPGHESESTQHQKVH